MQRDSKPLRVLVVDDEPLIRYGLFRFFENNAEVKTVGSAEEAIAEIGTQHYDLCFLDFILPGMTGLEAMKIINERSANTKVAIMTGSHLDEALKQEIDNTAFAFMEKPFQISRVREIADRVAGARSGEKKHE